MKKVLGSKVPCVKGKYHSVGIGSGVCSNCGKQICKPDPERATAFMETSRKITKQVFG